MTLLSMSALAGADILVAQDQDRAITQSGNPPQVNSQSAENIEAVPNRPTFSTTAETVQRGVFEIEYGLEAASGHQNINGLLKFGLVKNLELRFAHNPIERDAGTAGLGDCAAGFKYRFLKEKGVLPTLSVLYTLTIPMATAGLGAGSAGHAAGILASKDFGKHHLDFNESVQWLGRSGSGGFDSNYFTALAYAHPLTEKLGVTAEIAGFSRANTATPWTLTVLQALTYNISPRLVLDGGCYLAAHGNLPRATFFAGVTYAVVDLYRYLRGTHH
jgi:hypothetical protein